MARRDKEVLPRIPSIHVFKVERELANLHRLHRVYEAVHWLVIVKSHARIWLDYLQLAGGHAAEIAVDVHGHVHSLVNWRDPFNRCDILPNIDLLEWLGGQEAIEGVLLVE